MIQNENIVVFGEVLFDRFPNNINVLGGAPFNVAWNLRGLGVHPLFISKVGNDDAGAKIMQAMSDWGMSTDGVQMDEQLTTGLVNVHIENDEPSYDIVDQVAYDHINKSSIPYLPLSGIIYHGSLALRHANNEQALSKLITQMEANIFIDINLRPPWWDKQKIQQIANKADWIKLNQHELSQLAEGENETKRIINFFASVPSIKELILTRGEHGALSLTPEGDLYEVSPVSTENFVDTVGAGDAFSSVILLGKFLSWPCNLTIQRAQEFASAVVGIRGATSQDKSFYQYFSDKWDINGTV